MSVINDYIPRECPMHGCRPPEKRYSCHEFCYQYCLNKLAAELEKWPITRKIDHAVDRIKPILASALNTVLSAVQRVASILSDLALVALRNTVVKAMEWMIHQSARRMMSVVIS